MKSTTVTDEHPKPFVDSMQLIVGTNSDGDHDSNSFFISSRMFRSPTTSVGGNDGGMPLTTTTLAQSTNPSDTGDQSHRRSAASTAIQFHPAQPAIIDLFNLYLGVRLVFYESNDHSTSQFTKKMLTL